MVLKNQSPNMFVDYPDSGNYDLIMVNWYCETDATNTFWAVHQFSTNVVDGYAGFQNSSGDHVLMFSIWDHDSNYPVVEYVSSKTRLDNLNFGGEGTGKHIITDYDWEVGTWYTMCIGTKTVSGKTYYAQWIAKKGSTNWLLCGVISYPVANKSIGSSLMFQEDFSFNNLVKKCRLQDAFGRYNGTSNWHCWNSYTISNNFYKYIETTTPVSNFKYDCDHGVDSNSTYIYIQSGGESLTNPVERTMTLPDTISLTSSSAPSSYPSWSKLVPRYIKSKFSGLYIGPGSNNTVVQTTTPYYWNFIDSEDGYFYILTDDNSLAITITGTSDGDNLSLTTYNQLDTQKWTNRSVQYVEYAYFYPKNAPTKNIDIEGPTYTAGTPIQIWTHDETSDQFKWLALNVNEIHTIKSNFSSLYVNPSGTSIIQSSNAYEWNFVSTNDGYYYILSLDTKKAITVHGTYNGANLTYSDFVPGNNNQKWKLVSAGNNAFYIFPKCVSTLNMDIEGPVITEGAYIQVWTHTDGVSQFKWFID